MRGSERNANSGRKVGGKVFGRIIVSCPEEDSETALDPWRFAHDVCIGQWIASIVCI